jgi:hypothetical protein
VREVAAHEAIARHLASVTLRAPMPQVQDLSGLAAALDAPGILAA